MSDLPSLRLTTPVTHKDKLIDSLTVYPMTVGGQIAITEMATDEMSGPRASANFLAIICRVEFAVIEAIELADMQKLNELIETSNPDTVGNGAAA